MSIDILFVRFVWGVSLNNDSVLEAGKLLMILLFSPFCKPDNRISLGIFSEHHLFFLLIEGVAG